MKSITKLWRKPKNLTGYSADFYTRIGRNLIKNDILTDLDKDSFIALCGAYHLMQLSMDAVYSDGVNVQGSSTEIKKNPALTTYKNASDIFSRLCKKFYLTPEDRAGANLKKDEVISAKAKKHFLG